MIWARWFPPEASNYAGQVRPCSKPAGLGEINDDELNRLDWELEKGFNEALQSEKDFMDGVRVGFLKNMTKLPFNLAGFVLNSREVQDMPDKLESSDVEDEGAYLGGKITADVVTTVLGIIGIVSGVGQMVTGLAGDVGGGALCASGVGIPAGVAVVAGSTTLVVAGAAEVAASASLVYSSVSNFGRDADELKESKEKKETTSPEEGAKGTEASLLRVSKNTLKHIKNEHVPRTYAKQLKRKPKESVMKELERKSFFKSNWDKVQVEEAVNKGFNEAIKNGITNDNYTFIYSGEEVTVCLENGVVRTAYGNYHYSYDQLLNLVKDILD